jgi:uncharacterized protein YktA (UPF0223 family)
MMRKIVLAAAVAVFVVPTGSAIAKPSKADKREAQKECRALRGTDDASREAFKAQYRNFGACVSEKAHEANAERKQARRSAAKDCRDERSADEAAFKAQYHSFGACVSKKAKAKQKQQDEQDAAQATEQKNAAKECAAERDADSKAFDETYGTNHNKRNSFGKCVSQKVQADQ